ncbi:MAG: hypothetical protein ACMUHX_00035 [bacterium]
MQKKFVLTVLSFLLILLFLFNGELFSQYDQNNFIFAGNYPFSIYNLYNIYPYSWIYQSMNLQDDSLQSRNRAIYLPYSSLNNTSNNYNSLQMTYFDYITGNPVLSYNFSPYINPFTARFQPSGLSLINSSVPIFDNLFTDPLQSNNLLLKRASVTDSIVPLLSMFSQTEVSNSKSRLALVEDAESVNTEEIDLTPEVMALATELTYYVLTLADSMASQMNNFQVLAMETQPNFAESLEAFMGNAMGCSTEGQSFVESVLPMAMGFAEQGMEMAAAFAEKGMELGYEFASRGEEVGPMANRILFMATQIGVMADRIGEMSDRILFMADDIVKFGDKILYVSQLIVYTEQLMVNMTVLINETIDTISDMILTMMAITTNNEVYLELRADLLKNENQSLNLIYENMNKMLDHMLEYSLKLLENEALTEEHQLAVRELEIELRETTMSANDCYCPGFCVDPNQCI